MSEKIIMEGSTCTVTARFYGSTNQPATPSTIHYRIVDLTNDRIVQDWTEVAADEVVEVEIPAELNELYNDTNRKRRLEERVVVFVANQGEDIQHVNEERYMIRNVRGFDS